MDCLVLCPIITQLRCQLSYKYKDDGLVVSVVTLQGRIQDFFRRGCNRLLLYFNTNKPHSFFAEYQLY